MGNFSVNQVRHLYVVNSVTPETGVSAAALKTAVSGLSSKGASLLVNDVNPISGKPTHMYLIQKGAGGIVRSDLIPMDKILNAKKTTSTQLQHPLVLQKVVLDSTVNGGAPYAGQTYILNVLLRNYIGLGDEDTLQKFGMVYAYAGMTASQFYVRMAVSLAQNIGREETVPFSIYLGTTGTEATDVISANKVGKLSKEADFTGTYTCLYVEQTEQDWELGMMAQEFVNVYLAPNTVTISGEDLCWGVVTTETPVKVVPDGHKIADLEYFCMGARGDDYRMMGYPNIIKTEYMVDPTGLYDVIDIHYYMDEGNENPQKSERTITFVGSAAVITTLTAAIDAAYKLYSGKNLLTVTPAS